MKIHCDAVRTDASCMTTPWDAVVCAAAAYTTVFDCVKATLRTNGIRGPFQGLGPTLVRNAPANSIYLGSFEVMKGKMAEYKGCKKTELPAPWVISAGGLGGLLYWLAIYPVDVIKSAMATDSIIPKERKYPDMATTYKVCNAQARLGSAGWEAVAYPPPSLCASWGYTPMGNVSKLCPLYTWMASA